MPLSSSRIRAILGDDAARLLEDYRPAVAASLIHDPSTCPLPPWRESDRTGRTLSGLATLYGHGRLGGTGYLSLLPVDHGIAFGAGSAFAANPRYFDPASICELALEGGCSGIVTSYGVIGAVARRFAHRLPLVLKFNHDQLLSLPVNHDQILFAQISRAVAQGCVGVAATVYFGSLESHRQIQEVARCFSMAREAGLATILFCYLHNDAFTVDGVNHELSADLTGQANHLGATIEADIVKQKMPDTNGGYLAVGFGKTDPLVYEALTSDHPVDLTRYQVLSAYSGRAALINSGGPSGSDDLSQAVRAAVINKRAGGAGLLAGRKAFQRPLAEGIELLHTIQDVYLCQDIGVA